MSINVHGSTTQSATGLVYYSFDVIDNKTGDVIESRSYVNKAKAKEYFLNAAAKVSDIDSNALDELTKMLELVTRAFTGNVNTSPMNIGLDQALKRAKDEEEERSPLGES